MSEFNGEDYNVGDQVEVTVRGTVAASPSSKNLRVEVGDVGYTFFSKYCDRVEVKKVAIVFKPGQVVRDRISHRTYTIGEEGIYINHFDGKSYSLEPRVDFTSADYELVDLG